jgi:hypothetical protein
MNRTMAALTALSLGPLAELPAAEIRVGFIGLDSSHCTAFTEVLHREGNAGDLAGVRIVAAYPGGSEDFPLSRDRVAGYTQKMSEMGVEIVDSIDTLLPKIDVVILAASMVDNIWLRLSRSSRLQAGVHR